MHRWVGYTTPKYLGGSRTRHFVSNTHLDSEDYQYMPDTYNRFQPFHLGSRNNVQESLEYMLNDHFVTDFTHQQQEYLLQEDDSLEHQQRPMAFQPAPSEVPVYAPQQRQIHRLQPRPATIVPP